MIDQSKDLRGIYEAIIQTTPDLIYAFDLNYKFTYVNEALLKMWGRTLEDSVGKGLLEVGYEPWHAEMHEKEIDQVIATKKPIRGEVSFPHATLGKRIYDYIFAPVFNDAGKVIAISGTTRDISDIRNAEVTIIESEQNIRSMVLESPIGICVIDAATLVSEIVNDSFIEIAGKRYDEIAGKHYWDTFAEAKPYYETALNNVIKNGESYYANEVEMLLIRHGKEEIIYVTFVYAPLKNIEGDVKKVAVWVLDNTPQVITRRKIEESEERFRNTVKQAPVGITILRGPQYIVEMANDEYLQLVNRKEAEFVGKRLFDVLPEVKETVQPLLDGVLHSGVPYHGYEVAVPVNRYGKQEIGYFDFLYHPLKEDDGKISGIIVTVTEVSEKVDSRKKIEQNEERLNIVVNASDLGTWELNMKTMDTQYSQKYLEIIGGYKNYKALSHEELILQIHPDDIPVREKAMEHAIANGTLHYIARLVWKDQSIHWMEAKGKMFYDAEHKPDKMIGTIRDITAEKNYQRQLEESEERYRNLILQSPVAKAILKGRDYIIELANEAMLKNIWRKEKAEVIGKKMLDVFPELKKQKHHQLLEGVYTTGKIYTENESFISLNGNDGVRNYYIDFEYAPLFAENQKIAEIKITAVDVTEKVEARKKIEESEERFRSLAQTLPQLTWVTDEKGNAEFASSRWKEYSGIEPGGEKEWKAIVHPDDYDNINAAWMHSLATGNTYATDVRLKNKEGEYRWHSVLGEPVLNKENKIIKWVGAFTDMHDQKIREEQKDEFISIASHEMKTPLTTAKAYLQMLELLLDGNNEEASLYAKKASQSVSRLNELITELLDVSKIQLGKLNYNITTFSFNDMIDRTVENIQLTSQTHTIIKTGQVQDEVTGDKERLQQVVINLLTNAIKYSPGSKKVFITIAQEKDKIQVTVKDTGIGIAKQSLEKIFEKYHRVEEHAVHFQGLGIGLFISYEIIQRHQGQLWAKSEPGKGSIFYFTIPISSILPK